MTDVPTTTHVAQYLRELHEGEGIEVEKILVRRAGVLTYACQVWERGSQDPESFFIQLDDQPPLPES